MIETTKMLFCQQGAFYNTAVHKEWNDSIIERKNYRVQRIRFVSNQKTPIKVSSIFSFTCLPEREFFVYLGIFYFLMPCNTRLSCLMLSSSAPLCFRRLTNVIRSIIRWSAGLSFTAAATSPRSDAPFDII